MKKTILTIASALVVLSTVQLAAASEQRHDKVHHRAYTEFRDSNAYASPAYDAAQPGLYRYGGGISAPAGR